MNYRKKYELYLGYKLTPDIHVHHLDHNRANDCVSNLVAIPNPLHIQYHSLERGYNEALNGMNNGRKSDYDFYEFNFNRVLPKLQKVEETIRGLKTQQDKLAQKFITISI